MHCHDKYYVANRFVRMKRVDGIDNNKSVKGLKSRIMLGLTVNEWVTLVVEIYMNEIINIPSHHDGRKYIWASAR